MSRTTWVVHQTSLDDSVFLPAPIAYCEDEVLATQILEWLNEKHLDKEFERSRVEGYIPCLVRDPSDGSSINYSTHLNAKEGG